jgi:hypothetical protein
MTPITYTQLEKQDWLNKINEERHTKLMKSQKGYSCNMYNLNKSQNSIVNDTHPYKIIQGIRQSGKSKIIQSIALQDAIECPYTTIVIATYDLNNATCVVSSLMHTYINISAELKPALLAKNNTEIVFTNYSSIKVIPVGTPDVLQGLKIDTLLMDEVAFAKSDKAQSFYHTARCCQSTSSTSKVVIASTRMNRSKKNFFWKMWLDAMDGKNKFKPFKLAIKDCPHLKDRISDMRENMTRSQYDNQFTIRRK